MYFKRKFLVTGLLSSSLLIGACDSGDSLSDAHTGTISGSELSLPMPDRIRSISALDPNDIIATAIVNGVPTTLQADGNGSYRGSIQVPAQTAFSVQIEFSEIFVGQKLVLATISQQVTTGTTSQQLDIRRSGYDFNSHDDDGDSVSNIVEREENTNPLDAAQSPNMINVALLAKQPQLLAGGNFSQYYFQGRVGQSVKVLTASGGDFRGDFLVTDRAPVTAEVEMIESVTGQRFAVATQSRDLNAITDQQTIVFESNGYSIPDRDGDGRSDVAELIAGTDITVAGNPPVTTLAVRFDIPSLIQNAQVVYAQYSVGGQPVSLVRGANSLSASSVVNAGSTQQLEVLILDNYAGQPYVLASAQKTVVLNSQAQTVNFSAGDFRFDQDTDNDGTANYLERQQGTDPFNAPDPVSCIVDPLPLTAGLPGSTVVLENISDYIDCGSDDYVVDASSFGFSWNQQEDSLNWTIPSDSVRGSIFTYTINISSASLDTVYVSAEVDTQVEAVACTDTTEQFQFEATKDLYFQGGAIFNNDELRVNSSSRRSLLGFQIPEQAGELTAAALVMTVSDDSGSGTIGVYQDDSYNWDEDDDDLELPVLSNIVGSRDGAWQSDITYPIALDALYVSDDDVSLFLSQDSGSNDVAFTSRETSTPPVLVLEYTQCL